MATLSTEPPDRAAMRVEALAILGVTEEDDKKTIRQAFHTASRVHHPDRGGDPETFLQYREAYDFLTSGTVNEEFFCVTGGKSGSSVNLNRQNPALFSKVATPASTPSDDEGKHKETVVFVLCPLCNQPYKKGRPMRAHLQSDRHALSDVTTPKLGDVVLASLDGIHVEAKVVEAVVEPYSTTEDTASMTYVSVSVSGMKLLKSTAEKDGRALSGGGRKGPNGSKRKCLSAHQGRLRAKKKAAAAAATVAIKSRKMLHPGLAACRDGELDVLKELLAAGSYNPLVVRDNNGSNGIHWCSGSGHLAVLQHLLEWCKEHHAVAPEVLVNQKDTRSGRNAFHWAARNGQLHLCEYLLVEYGMDLDCTTNDGTSAFHLAAWSGELIMCKWLVEKGGDPHIVNSFGCNAIHFACLAGNLEMCQWLHGSVHLDAFLVQLQGHHTLHKAAWAGHKDVCAWLQDTLGVDPESTAVDHKGHTASRLAEIAGHVELSIWLERHRRAKTVDRGLV
jgi:ankyrin repeat protein